MDKKIFSVFSRVLIITVIVKIFDVSKNLLIAYFLGVSNDADVYMAIISIPESVLILLGIDTLRGVVNSEYSSLNTRSEPTVIKNSFQNLFKLLFWLSFIFLIIIYIFRGEIIRLFFPGFYGQKYLMASAIAIVIFPVFLLKGVSGLVQSLLNSYKRFYLPICVQMFISLSIIIFMFLPKFHDNFLYNLSYGYLIGNFISLFILIISTRLYFFPIRIFDFKFDKVTLKIIKSSFSILLLVICNQIFNSSKNFFASFYGEGAVSALSYASALPSLITALIFSSVFSVLLSNLSSSFSKDARIVTKKIYFNSLIPIFYIVIPLVSFLYVYGYDVLVLLYKRGGFNIEGIELTHKLFVWENLSMIGWIIQVLTLSLFLAKKKYVELSVIGCIMYLFGILLNFFLTKLQGLYGIPISSFVTNLVYGLILFYRSRVFFGRIRIYINKLLLILVSGTIAAVILYLFKYFTYNSISIIPILYLSYLFVSFIICFLVYASACSIFKIKYAETFMRERIFSHIIR